MTRFRSISLAVGLLTVGLVASAAAAGTSPWLVVARSHKWPTTQGIPMILVKMPVRVVNGKRQPEALGLRLLVRQNGRYRRGSYAYDVRCGGWHRFRQFTEVMTPVTREIPFRTWRASRCTVSISAMSARGSDDVRLQLLCRARSQRACTPIQ